MTAKTFRIALDSNSTDNTVPIDVLTSAAMAINRGEPVIIHAAFFVNGTIRTDYTDAISFVLDIYRPGSSDLLARATTQSVNAITNANWLSGQYHCEFSFPGAQTANCNTGTIGHDTFQFVAYVITNAGNVALGKGLFVVYGQVPLTNPTLPVDALTQIYMIDQNSGVYKTKIVTDETGTHQVIE